MTNLSTKDLVVAYNKAAAFLGKPSVKRFETRAAGLARTAKMTAEAEAKTAADRAAVEAADKSFAAAIKVAKTNDAKPVTVASR